MLGLQTTLKMHLCRMRSESTTGLPKPLFVVIAARTKSQHILTAVHGMLPSYWYCMQGKIELGFSCTKPYGWANGAAKQGISYDGLARARTCLINTINTTTHKSKARMGFDQLRMTPFRDRHGACVDCSYQFLEVCFQYVDRNQFEGASCLCDPAETSSMSVCKGKDHSG